MEKKARIKELISKGIETGDLPQPEQKELVGFVLDEVFEFLNDIKIIASRR